jgi:hypothetical protein
MELKTKYQLGELLVSKNHRYMGKVIKVATESEESEGVIKTFIMYTIRANEGSYKLPETDVFKLEVVKDVV